LMNEGNKNHATADDREDKMKKMMRNAISRGRKRES